MSDENKAQETVSPEAVDGAVQQSRRKTLKRLGCYALYTAPAVLLLFASEKAAAVS